MLNFTSTSRRRKFKKKKRSPVVLDLCLRKKTRSGKSHDYHNAIVFKNLRFQNAFRLYENENTAFSNCFRLKIVFEKLRFRDGSVWTVGVTLEMNLRFEISPA